MSVNMEELLMTSQEAIYHNLGPEDTKNLSSLVVA